MNTMLRRQIMDCAWDIANTATTFFGGNSKDFIGKSLELIYAGMDKALVPFTTCQEVKLEMASHGSLEGKLIQLGGNEWKNYGKHRIYLNIDVQMKLLGLEVTSYKTGNIKHAKLNGEDISNTRAAKIIGSLDKFWYDVRTGHCGWSRYANNGIANDIRKAIEAL